MRSKTAAKLAAAVLMLAALVWAQDKKDSQGKKPDAAVASIRVTVHVLDQTDSPVQGAGVVLRQASVETGRLGKDPFQVELHTDSKGTVAVQGFAPGVVLVQVIAHGYQTWGQAFIMKHADETVHVKLDPPQRQISIYK